MIVASYSNSYGRQTAPKAAKTVITNGRRYGSTVMIPRFVCPFKSTKKLNDGKETAQGGFSCIKGAVGISAKNWLCTTCDSNLRIIHVFGVTSWKPFLTKKTILGCMFSTILQPHYCFVLFCFIFPSEFCLFWNVITSTKGGYVTASICVLAK